jgi:hypothetical protein
LLFLFYEANRLSNLLHLAETFDDFEIQDDQDSGLVSKCSSRLPPYHVLLAFDRICLV